MDLGADKTLFPPNGDLMVKSGSVRWLLAVINVVMLLLTGLVELLSDVFLGDTEATSSGWQKLKDRVASELPKGLEAAEPTSDGAANENEVEATIWGWSGGALWSSVKLDCRDIWLNGKVEAVDDSRDIDEVVLFVFVTFSLLKLNEGIVLIGRALLWEAKKAGRGSTSSSSTIVLGIADALWSLSPPTLALIFPPLAVELISLGEFVEGGLDQRPILKPEEGSAAVFIVAGEELLPNLVFKDDVVIEVVVVFETEGIRFDV